MVEIRKAGFIWNGIRELWYLQFGRGGDTLNLTQFAKIIRHIKVLICNHHPSGISLGHNMWGYLGFVDIRDNGKLSVVLGTPIFSIDSQCMPNPRNFHEHKDYKLKSQ